MPIKVLQTLDVDQQRTAIDGWQQHYAQMSSGRFHGSIVHAQCNGVEAYEERMNTRVEQHFHAPDNALVFSFDMADGALYLLNSQSQNTWITPENYREVAVVVDLNLMGQAPCADSLDGLLLTPLKSQQSQVFSSWLSYVLNTLSATPGASLDANLSRQLVDDCLFVLDSSSRSLDQPRQRRLAEDRRIVSQVFELASAYPEDNFNVLQLATAAGVTVRQLQHSFTHFTGITPSAWLRLRRLNAAHRDLARAAPEETTVAEVAMRWSFWHLGRFSEAYRGLFNEQPKCTLQRRGA
ncbi:helix-turn-helix domain-containing protein [Pseudomonas sp. GV071]|jgi:AraC-like DNA-binding protein|uniref:helix-turn-helix domain-containing protein n=1 Tax=Pseudomonas sp. GV071 TaxID=2135754 RepID=UPI000D3454F2|nr:helix-turn-helix domain-containing protein [Pseudomonas sp. GV071]PTQ70069.1 AraC family transcriptional regulator [Pseudomonas sp. GV071]